MLGVFTVDTMHHCAIANDRIEFALLVLALLSLSSELFFEMMF